MKIINMLVILSILLTALPGLAAIASAEEDNIPALTIFYGTASLDGDWAQPGTVIEAYIGGELCGSVEVITEAWYIDLAVSSESDEGKEITFKVGGRDADQTAVWHARNTPESKNLNLSTGPAPTTPAPGSGGGSGGSGLPTTTSTDENASSAVSEETESSSTSSTTEPVPSAAETATTPNEPGAESDDDSGFLSGFGMILAVIVVAGIIVAVYLVSKRS